MGDLIERLRARADEMDRRLGATGVQADLREAAAALEAAREDACVALVADIRFACGDNGKRMQPELVEFIRQLAADAVKWRTYIAESAADVSHVCVKCAHPYWPEGDCEDCPKCGHDGAAMTEVCPDGSAVNG